MKDYGIILCCESCENIRFLIRPSMECVVCGGPCRMSHKPRKTGRGRYETVLTDEAVVQMDCICVRNALDSKPPVG